MIISPIIPLWIMIPISVTMFFFIKKDGLFRVIRQILIIILLFVINIRIMVQNDEVEVMTCNVDVLFVIDTTISMNAEDYGSKNDTRLQGVINDCTYIVRELEGANFSIITFDNDAKVEIPYTKNNDSLENAINCLKTMEELYARGSSLNQPLETMENVLSQSSKKNNRKRILFFISDGEITNNEELKSFDGVKKYVDGGAVLGYGTVNGGNMKNLSKTYNDGKAIDYIYDKTSYPYKKAISKLDEENLKKIAKDIDIEYIHMENQSNIDKKIKEIKNSFWTNDETDKEKSYVDIYYVFAVPLLILLLIEFIHYKKGKGYQ